MIASLSAAIGHDVPDAVQEAMERAETERMRRIELESFVAQDYFVQNLQTHPRGTQRTWQSAYRGHGRHPRGARSSIGPPPLEPYGRGRGGPGSPAG